VTAPAASTPHGVRLRGEPGSFPLFALLGVAVVVAAFAVRLLGLDHLLFNLCTFKAITGFPCLSCGTTRALALLAGGDPGGALAMNPVATLVAVGLGILAVLDLGACFLRGCALRLTASPRAAKALRIVIPLVAVANWGYLIAMGR
jgi:hypothetical protein